MGSSMENVLMFLINTRPANILVVLTLINFLHVVTGGICWLNKSKDDLCTGLFKRNMTKDECCSYTEIPSIAWSSQENPTNGDIFYWKRLSGGAPKCYQCHNSCDVILCPRDKKCRMKKGKPKCICKPRCNPQIRRKGKLCGTDGRNYKNYCRLLRHNCKKDRSIEIAYFGKCKRSCKKVKCMNGKHCLEDQDGMPHCVSCHTTCPPDTKTDYVCGDDNNTYKSICHLRSVICLKGRKIRIAYSGRCRDNATCDNTVCPDDYTCLKQLMSNRPQCINCQRSELECPKFRRKMQVCGTDGQTYKNSCELKRIACRTKLAIHTRSNGPCKRRRNHTCRKCRKHRRKAKRRKKKLRSLLTSNMLRSFNVDEWDNTIPVRIHILRHSGRKIIGTNSDFG